MGKKVKDVGMTDSGEKKGLFVVVPTPIGNLDDMTYRAVSYLKKCNRIACEDTRHTQRLLDYYQIRKPLISYHEHNEQERAEDLLGFLKEGEIICLVSDAGTPGISDPGGRMIKELQKNKMAYTVLPGPSAVNTAVVASGVGDGTYSFLGFLPRKGQAREEILEKMDKHTLTSVIYESPHRIRKSLEEFGKRWPDRDMAIARELTKVYEEVIRFKGREVPDLNFVDKGEFVVLIGPNEKADQIWTQDQVESRFEDLYKQGLRSKTALKMIADQSHWKKNDLYPIQLEVKTRMEEKKSAEE